MLPTVMLMNRKLFLCASLVLAITSASAAPQLKIGDPAPPILAAKWFKGPPVTEFDPNLVYVVEFWATWCGPCKESIPHLTELAKKYDGKARIVGVSIWETAKTNQVKRLATVGKFVANMGDKMDYSVAADDNEGFMAKNWMAAAEENGIPTAFIVGRDGKLAWVGYPWAGLDEKLEQTIAGTLDAQAVQAEAAQRQREKDAKAREGERLKPVLDLQQEKKSADAIAALEKLIAAHPELAAKTGFLRYRLLLAGDEPAAYRQARQLLAGDFKDNAGALYQIARDLTDPPGRPQPDWDLALAVARRACELRQFADPSTLSTLAEAYHGMGDRARAIETAELAIRKAEADSNYPAGSTRYLKRRLEVFKASPPADGVKARGK